MPDRDQPYTPPEWLVEKAARAVRALYGDAGADDLREYEPDLRAAFSALLSECPVLGLSRDEVQAVLRGRHTAACLSWPARSPMCECGYESARSKLLATRKALEGGEGG